MLDLKPFAKPENYTLNELKQRLEIIKKAGYIAIFGKERSAAYGESLEQYLGLKKSSSKKADWGDYELKTITSMTKRTRLFSIKWNYLENHSPKELVRNFGKKHHSKHLSKPVIRLDWKIKYSYEEINELHFYLDEEKGMLLLKHGNTIIANSNLIFMKEHFLKKIKNLVLIEIKPNKNPRISFRIDTIRLYENASYLKFVNSLVSNNVEIEFALMLIDPNTNKERLNNRGSTFIINSKNLEFLFENFEIL